MLVESLFKLLLIKHQADTAEIIRLDDLHRNHCLPSDLCTLLPADVTSAAVFISVCNVVIIIIIITIAAIIVVIIEVIYHDDLQPQPLFGFLDRPADVPT